MVPASYTCVNSHWILQTQSDNSCTSLCYASLGIISSSVSTTRQGRLEQGCIYASNPNLDWYVKNYTLSVAADTRLLLLQLLLPIGLVVGKLLCIVVLLYVVTKLAMLLAIQLVSSVSLEKDLDAGVEYVIQVSNYDGNLNTEHTPFTLTIDPTE